MKQKSSGRQMQLQGIIKALQSKIHALKRQHSQNKAQQQFRIDEALSKQRQIMQQKEKTISFLKQEINKIRLQSQKEIKTAVAHYEQEQKKIANNLSKLKSKNQSLNAEMQKKIQVYQNKLQEKQAQINKILFKYELLDKQKRILAQQRQQFTKFYQNSIHKLPERQQTLLWVDKLIDFMSKTQNILSNELKERQSTINQVTKLIKDQLYQINNDYVKNDAILSIQKQKFIEQFHSLISQAQQDYNEAIKSNIQCWQAFSKAKAKDEAELITKLQSQLAVVNDKHHKQIEALQQKCKASQKEKKSLLLSFQQMKNLYQLKDKTNKEEIELLKQSVSQLLESQQIRQRQFETQITRLGEKIEAITTKFHEKLDLPLRQVQNKIKLQIQSFKNQFQGFYSNSLLQGQLQTFENHIVQYLVSLNNSKQERMYLKTVAESNVSLIEGIKADLLKGQDQKGMRIQEKDRRMAYSTVSHNAQYRDKELKDKENKLNYQLATTKKQLEKLKQYCKQLQAKSKTKDQHFSSTKTIELAAQNELLRQRLLIYQRNSGEGSINETRLMQAKLARINTPLLQKILSNSQLIIKFTQSQYAFIEKMSKCISSLNTFIINPVQMFQKLTSQVQSIKIHSHGSLPIVKEEVVYQNRFQMRKEAFSAIINKKIDVNGSLQRTSNELGKVLRDLLAKYTSSKNKNVPQQDKMQVQKFKPSESRYLLQKRIKQVQTQRIKNREEMLSRLKILDDKFKSIQQKYTKKQTISFNKVQQNICKKIQQMMNTYNGRQKFKDLSKITQQAFNDLQSKLKECLIDNQGLIKQIQLLKSSKY